MPLTDKPRCKTCRWWERTRRYPDKWGMCRAKKMNKVRANHIWFYESDYEPLHTRHDFGCIFHEERE